MALTIQQAIDFIAGKMIEKEKEIEVLKLAQDALLVQFKPNIDELIAKRDLVDKLTQENNQLKTEKQVII